jgi:2'-5' RNA ligase
VYLPPVAEGQTRIGFSIPVPPPWAEEIASARARFGDPYADMIPTHITIVGPTAIDTASLPALIVQLDIACDQVAPFEVELKGTGTFQPVSPVAFVEVTKGAAECAALANAARKGPLSGETRFPYHPHVTLAHGVSDDIIEQALAEFADLSVRFAVDAVWLYRHFDDGVWRKICRFDLRGRVSVG